MSRCMDDEGPDLSGEIREGEEEHHQWLCRMADMRDGINPNGGWDWSEDNDNE